MERSNQFKIAWVNANASGQKFKLSDIDQQLHLERINSAHEKVTFQTTLAELPIGTCFEWHDQAVMIVAINFIKHASLYRLSNNN